MQIPLNPNVKPKEPGQELNLIPAPAFRLIQMVALIVRIVAQDATAKHGATMMQLLEAVLITLVQDIF